MQSPPDAAGSPRLIDLLMDDAPGAVGAHDEGVEPRMLWEAFVEQAHARPDAPAVIGSGGAISYDRLLQSALSLSRTLRQAGVDQSAPVAVLIGKRWEQIAAAIGIQFAGAAYLPVPADWPPLRIAELIESTGARVAVLVDGDQTTAAPPAGLTIVAFSGVEPAARLDDRIERRDPGDLAYIIPTSGTTGTPKAVMVEHGAAWNTVQSINTIYRVGAHDRVLALSSLSFDLSVYDIFGLLAAGGAIVLPDAARMRDPEHWIALCRSAEVTIWNSVPPLARMLVEGGLPRGEALTQCRSLRLMMLSGDWIPLSLAQRVREQRPDLELVSLGGATEASIWSNSHPIKQIDSQWKSIPYGTALPGQSIAVLDEGLERLPPWVEGEIYIGGIGLARGYWRDEELTRARFVTHPRTGARFYRTGDLGKMWPDGVVELLGRIDSQVKISGHRVELGEIEAHLQALPGVRAAAISYRPVGPMRRQELVAYVVLADAARRRSGPITDPVGRLQFKLCEPGRRRLTGATAPVALGPMPDALEPAFRARRTHRAFDTGEVTRASLAALLIHVAQLELDGFALAKRLYPSAGSLYPVQIYLHVRADRVTGLGAGGYYYDPRTHALAPLAVGSDLPASCFGGVNLRAAEQAAFSIFLVGELDAIAPLYPDQARDFCLLEAGYIGQVLMTAASGAGLGLCPIGGVEGDDWRSLFQLSDSHTFLHAFLGGAPVESGVATRIDGDPVQVPADGDRAHGQEDVARLLRQAGETETLRELRMQLGNRLPSHMIPSSWVVLDALPLTDNDKVDRQHLPEPVAPDAPSQGAAPETLTETTLLALWRSLLGDRVRTIDQGFFDAGGDSLLLLELQDRLRLEFAVDVPLGHFFEHPSIRSLAAWLDQQAATRS